MSERFKVEIYGQTYSMQGDLDPIYVAELASYVDEKMAFDCRRHGLGGFGSRRGFGVTIDRR